MVTINDVASYAGVSKASVSRVVNGQRTSNEIHLKVSAAMQHLGYHPNLIARALSTNRNPVIGIMVSEGFTRNPVVMEFLAQLLVKVGYLNKPLVLVQTNGGFDSLETGYKNLAEQRCEGIICITECNDKAGIYTPKINTLRKINQIPTVMISAPQEKACFLITHICSHEDEFEELHLPLDESIEQVMASFKN